MDFLKSFFPGPSARIQSAWWFGISMIWFINHILNVSGHAEPREGSGLSGPGAPPSITFRFGDASNQAPHAFLLSLPRSLRCYRQHHAQCKTEAGPHLDQSRNDRSGTMGRRDHSIDEFAETTPLKTLAFLKPLGGKFSGPFSSPLIHLQLFSTKKRLKNLTPSKRVSSNFSIICQYRNRIPQK